MKHLFVLLIFYSSLVLIAQDDTEIIESFSLSERYRLQILETATLEELKELAIESGLSDSGNRSALLNRLKSHYELAGVSVESSSIEGDEGTMQITIESAKSSRSIEVHEKNGQELLLEGGVILRIEQAENNTEHLINADRIVFSKITDQVSAYGNIHYIRKDNGKEESFYGDSLTFLMKGWKGIIFNALSQKEDEQEDQTVEFFFQGNQFKSSGNETFIMEKGSISSGNPDDLYYHIQARKIWILGPQEWGLLSGVFYIGRVPLLYMPLYYRPGNEMIINPVMGYRNREGTLIQTTLYLMGRKESDNQSFFNAGIVTDDEYELTREGLYLFKGDKLERQNQDKNTLKIMFDWYSKLGIYSGLYGYIENDSRTLKFRSAAAFSQSIGNNGEIYFLNAEGVLSNRPNKTYFYGLEIPFRWELEFSVDWEHLNIELEYITDSSFRRDFHQRKESFDWLNWLLEERIQDYTEDSLTTSLLWSINYRNNFRIQSWSPYINKLDINELSLNLFLNQDVDENLKLLDPYNPAVNYFYPNNFIPRLSLSSGGTLFSKTYPVQEDSARSITGIPRPPMEGEASVGIEDPEDLYPFEMQNTIPVDSNHKTELSLTWKLTPKWSMDTPFLSEEWDSAEDIDMKLDFAEFMSDINGSVNYSLRAMNSMLVFTGQNQFSSHYKEYKDLSNKLGEPEADLILNENLFNDLNWQNNMNLQVFPLKSISEFSSSSISYTMNHKVYNWEWDSADENYSSQWFGFQDDMILLNQYKIQTVYQPLNNFRTECIYSGENYPDRDRNRHDINAKVNFSYGPLTQNFQQTANWRPEEDWKMGNFNSSSTLTFWDDLLILNNNLTADMDEKEITSDSLKLTLWNLYILGNWKKGPVYQWDQINYQWIQTGDEFHLETITGNFSMNEDLPLLWKNRISQEIKTTLNWTMNMNQVNQNKLSFILGYTLGIYEFMDLSFNVTSSNNSMFLYFKSSREELGINENRSMLQDLLNSFAFFSKNQQLRKDSFFNMQSIDVTATHYMGNWTAFLTYKGKPDVESGITQWDSSFSFLIQWIPINSIKSKIEMDEDEEWTATTDWED